MRRVPPALLTVMALCACASHPRHTALAPPVVARNETPVSTHAPNGASQSDPNAELLRRGYKPVTVRGEVHYCRREMLTGSRFTGQVCLTPDQIKELQDQARENLRINPMGCGDVNFCK